MCVLLGFDPGGSTGRRFGWCVIEDAPSLPLVVRAKGRAANADEAVRCALHVAGDSKIVAAGIDAPMFWVATGGRIVDGIVRDAQRGRVLAVNSLQGACLVQGVLAAMLLRNRIPQLPISESHPKALIRLKGISPTIRLVGLSRFFRGKLRRASQDERDAAVAGLSAWAVIHKPRKWSDLYCRETKPISPLNPHAEYWMPLLNGRSC